MNDSSVAVTRFAARVILLDRDDRVLLLRGGDSTRPEAGSWWFTLGGGIEDHESAEQAAVREVREESGLALSEVYGPLYAQTIDLIFEGAPLHQSEKFFAARVTRFAVVQDGRTELEKRTLSESRWWSAEELDATTETFYPRCLPALVRRAIELL